jgi:ferrous iron transport protein A
MLPEEWFAEWEGFRVDNGCDGSGRRCDRNHGSRRAADLILANTRQYRSEMVAIALLSDFRVEDGEEFDLSGAWKLRLLSELPIGTVGVVESLDLPGEIQHHLMHMGFVPEARVMVVRRAPAGDPTVYSIDGFEVALRRDTAKAIRVREYEMQ